MKIAFLIDGGFFLKRFRTLYPDVDSHDAREVVKRIQWLIGNHLKHQNKTRKCSSHWSLLFRSFYYDAWPYEKQGTRPVSGRSVNFRVSAEATFRRALFQELRKTPNMALRLGEVHKEGNRSWILKPGTQKDLLARRVEPADLTDDDFVPASGKRGWTCAWGST